MSGAAQLPAHGIRTVEGGGAAHDARPASAWSPRGWPAERPADGPSALEAWCYTDRWSYAPGDRVDLHVHTTAPAYAIEVVRDGLEPEVVLRREGLRGERHATPEDAFAVGCGWPVSLSFEVPEEWRSGFYLVIVRVEDPAGGVHEREHFFIVRSPRPGADTPLVLVLATGTLMAYNDWGGANHYRGIGSDPRDDIGAPRLALKRPIARGMLRKPEGAPREGSTLMPPPGWRPRYEAYEWARLNGYGRHHADAGWATYERPFVRWAEQAGYRFDMLTQHDLETDPDALAPYRCAVVVGHDEYWSWNQRDAIDRFVEGGGGLARFGGNYEWQVRLEDDGDTQVCHRLPSRDPVAATQPHLATTIWEARSVGRPGASTIGLNGCGGIYNRYGTAMPRSSGGFTIYRPDHWVFEGTDLYYGDQLGGWPMCIAGFEVDSVEFTFHRGLPYPTYEDGAPESLEILGLAPASLGETDRWKGATPLGAPLDEFTSVLEVLGDDVPEYLRDRPYGAGAGMIATFTRGAGTVVNTGTTEWVRGLIAHDPFTERITRNVLDRLTR